MFRFALIRVEYADDVGEEDQMSGRPQLVFYVKFVNMGLYRAHCFADQAIPAVTTSKPRFEFCGVGVKMCHPEQTHRITKCDYLSQQRRRKIFIPNP